MIRKAIIVVLTVAELGTFAGWGLTCTGATFLCSYFPPPPLSYGGVGLVLTDSSVRCYCRKRCESIRPPVAHSWRGFAFNDEVQVPGTHPVTVNMRNTEVSAPAWAVAALFGWYPALAFIRGPLRRWRRHRKGLCLKCGYNLKGNVTGKCSECGTETEGDK